MEIITLIQWNVILYGLYYSLNLAYDYNHHRSEKEDEPVSYDVKNLLNETPIVVQNPGLSDTHKGTTRAEEVQKSQEQTESVNFHSAIEGQGIPLPEFLVNSKQFSSGIYS